MLIRAAVLRERTAAFTLEDVELADPGPGEVVVQIAGVGFCHTDVMPRAEGFMARPPLILGHEGSGLVVATGPGTSIAAGTGVVLSFDHCGRCANCLDGHPGYCRSFWGRNAVGRSRSAPNKVTDTAGEPVGAHWFGQSSFATHALVREASVVPVPHDVPLELMGPLGCGVLTGAGAVFNCLEVRAATSMAIYGAGAVGLAAIMAAAASGATQIIAVDRHPARLRLARSLGATDVVHVEGRSTDVGQAVLDLSRGGVAAALDTTGVAAVIAAAVNALRVRGVLALVSMASSDIVLPGDALATGRTITGLIEGDAVPNLLIPQLVELWRAGRLPFDRLITTYPLTDINRAEADMADGQVVKPVLIPAGAPGGPR